jgi:hypothetical protein
VATSWARPTGEARDIVGDTEIAVVLEVLVDILRPIVADKAVEKVVPMRDVGELEFELGVATEVQKQEVDAADGEVGEGRLEL